MRRAVELNRHNPIVLGVLAWSLANQGELELAVPLAHRAKELNPQTAGFFDYPMFVDHYVHGRYEQALVHTELGLAGPGQFIEPLVLAATLGQLGRVDEAAPALAELRTVWNRLCEQAGCDGLDVDMLRRELTERWVVSESITDKLIERLEKAGLKEARPGGAGG